MFVLLYDFFRRRQILCWSLFAALLLLASLLASRIRFTQDVASMLPDSRALKAMNEVVSGTQAGEQVIFMASFQDSTIADPDSLISATQDYYAGFQEKLSPYIDTVTIEVGGFGEALPGIVRSYLPVLLSDADFAQLDSLLTAEHIEKNLAANKSLLLSPASTVFKDIVAADPVGLSGLVWKKLSALQYDPNYEAYNGHLFSKDGKRLTFFLKPHFAASETGRNAQFFRELDAYTDQWQVAHPGVRVTYFGGPAVAAGNASQLQTDTVVTLSVTVLLLLALTFYYFRRKRTPLLLLVPVLFGALTGLAVSYLVQGSVSVIALGAGAIVLGIAMDYSIHFLSHARDTSSMRETVRDMQQPLTLGSLTTIAAFLSLRFVSTPILQDLGLFAAAALVGAALCTLIFLPHFPHGLCGSAGTGAPTARRATFFDRLGRWQPEKNRWLVLCILLLTPVLLWFSLRVGFDDDLMHLNYLSPRLEAAQEEVSRANAYALSSMFIVAGAGDEQEALARLERARPAVDTLTARGLIRSASYPSLLIPSEAEQRRRAARWQSYWTPEKRRITQERIALAAARAGFNAGAFTAFDELMETPPPLLDSESVRTLKQLYPGGFSQREGKSYAIAALKVPQESRRAVLTALSRNSEVVVTDRQQGAQQLVTLLRDDFNNIALYSSLIVFFALLLGYGRFELALMSFLPMAISWIWILGLMALLGLRFNIVNIIISTLIFGLGDDYSIFTMDGLIDRYKKGEGKLQSVRTAVYVSVFTVLIGLGVLLLAKHPALRSIAFISVTGLLCVLFISQTLQPFLFNWFIQRRADKGFLPFTLWSFAKSVFAFFYFFTGSLVLTLLGIFFTKLWPAGKEKGRYLLHVWLSRYTWSMMYIMGNVRKRIVNRQLADFSRPAVYIANHASFLDILITTMLHPRLVLLTNKWVWRSPVFGAVVRMAEYYPVAEGAEDSLAPLQDLVARGYSIVVFPEGTRSETDKIARFKKGAFYIAEKLRLDIVPLVLHGVHYTMQKGDWLLKDGRTSVYFHQRIQPGDDRFGNGYAERAKQIGRWFRGELDRVKTEVETPAYFREQLLRSYTYKGPVLEWYCRVKTALEGNYESFHRLIPREGRFYDLGCGYGFMTYMLQWAANGRRFTGIDYDDEKIETAQHNFLRNERIHFDQGDLSTFTPRACEGIFILDVLHYLLPEQQVALLERCVTALAPGGTLVVRDGVEELQERHRGTRLTELFSTRIFRFNKTRNALHFLRRSSMEAFAVSKGLSLEILDNTQLTSNLVFVMRKP